MVSDGPAPRRRVLLSISDDDLSVIADLADRARDHGVTHVAITPLAEKSRWEIDDASDP